MPEAGVKRGLDVSDAVSNRESNLLNGAPRTGTETRLATTTARSRQARFSSRSRSAVQQVAFTVADGIAYVQAALDAGLGHAQPPCCFLSFVDAQLTS